MLCFADDPSTQQGDAPMLPGISEAIEELDRACHWAELIAAQVNTVEGDDALVDACYAIRRMVALAMANAPRQRVEDDDD